MPPKKKTQKTEKLAEIIMSSPAPRPRRGATRTTHATHGRGCGCMMGSGYGSASQANVIATSRYSLTPRPRRMLGKGIRPSLSSLVLNTYGRA